MTFFKKAFVFLIVITFSTAIFIFALAKIDGGPNLLHIGNSAPLPDYWMEDISGMEINLNFIRKENGLLVIFSCNTCPFVIAWEDRYPLIANQCNLLQVGMLAVNSNEAKREGDDSKEEMVIHAKDKEYNFNYAVDRNSVLAKAFGATKTPQIFLFDKNLKLVYTGAIDDNLKNAEQVEKPYLKNAINNLVAGKAIDPNVTKAMGCSIKKVKVGN